MKILIKIKVHLFILNIKQINIFKVKKDKKIYKMISNKINYNNKN